MWRCILPAACKAALPWLKQGASTQERSSVWLFSCVAFECVSHLFFIFAVFAAIGLRLCCFASLRGQRMRAVEPPLLRDTQQTAGENIYGQPAGIGNNEE